MGRLSPQLPLPARPAQRRLRPHHQPYARGKVTGPKMTGRKITRRSAARAELLPAARGYRMPAEWEPHESTWLAWPHFRGDWPGKFEPIPWVYAEILRNLARHVRVDLIVNYAGCTKR